MESTTINTVQDSLHDTQHDTSGVTSAAQPPVATLQQELLPACTEAERAAQLRKIHKLKCQGHATQGAVARYYPVPAGREAVPQPTEAEREKIFSYTPPRACQVNRLVKCMRSERVQEVTDQDGHVVRIALKPMARDMALNLSLQIEVLKPAKRADYVDQLLNYFMAPNGLGREDHQRSRALLERLEPHHILDLARNCELPVWQDLIAEANEAWGDPKEAQLSLYEREVPERPKAKDANDLIACLSERSALFSEPIRLVLKDLIRILNDGQPAKLRNFMVPVKEMLTLSSKGMIDRLIELGQNFIRGAGIDPLINPKAYEAANGDLHQRLQALMIVPKRKKVAAKKAVGQKPAEMQDALMDGTDDVGQLKRPDLGDRREDHKHFDQHCENSHRPADAVSIVTYFQEKTSHKVKNCIHPIPPSRRTLHCPDSGHYPRFLSSISRCMASTSLGRSL